MDAFYASVEQRDEPSYRGKPVIVGGMPEGRGGVVAAASYEARRFGVRSAMPSRTARELCPQAIFLRPRFEVYTAVSRQLRDIFRRYTDLIEPLSLDEAYLDVTSDKAGVGSAITIAEEIREAIATELGLTASAGVSVNKFVAKIASDLNKPDGLTFIGPSKVEAFMETLAVERFFGVGKVTASKMHAMGLYTGADLKKLTEAELIREFGKIGSFFYFIVRGIDNRPVLANRETKSIGAEDTFPEDIISESELITELDRIARVVHERLTRHGLWGRTITIKIRFGDFRQITRSQSFDTAPKELQELLDAARQLLASLFPLPQGVRLLGISASNFHERPSMAASGFAAAQLQIDFNNGTAPPLRP